MSDCKPGTPVSHPDFGDGIVLRKIGAVVRVDFFGEPIDVTEGDLTFKVQHGPRVADAATDGDVTDRIPNQFAPEEIMVVSHEQPSPAVTAMEGVAPPESNVRLKGLTV